MEKNVWLYWYIGEHTDKSLGDLKQGLLFFSRKTYILLWEERGSNRIPTLEGLGCWEATEKRIKNVTGRADGGR